MISLSPISSTEAEALSELSKKTFIESHGHSAKPADINTYIDTYFNTKTLENDLQNPEIRYHKILVNSKLAGYSKLKLNTPNQHSKVSPVAKLERIYLKKDYYGLQLGHKLLEHNLEIAKTHHQKALWLFVWVENEKALRFYKKNSFKIIGKHDFKISKDHYNPNFVMQREI